MPRTLEEVIIKQFRQLGTQLCCTLQNAIIGPQSILQFTIGDGNPGTPTDGSDTYLNPLLDGKTIHISKNGVGYLTEGTGSGDYQLVTGGGFQLQGGAIFSTGETYVVFLT